MYGNVRRMSSMSRRTTMIVLLTMASLQNAFDMAWCMDPQEVHNFNFNFRRNCHSITINWTTPTYQNNVSRYIVQSAQGCPDMWKNQAVLNGTVHSVVIEDLALVTSCLLGMCHIRIAADLEYSDSQSMRKLSHCVRISSSFYNSSETKENVHYIGQQVCLLIRTQCPTIPTFYIGEQMIILTGTEGIDDDYYLSRNQLCIRNINSDTNLVVHEVCHYNTMCPLCDEDSGELVLMTRAEVQTITSNNMITMQPDINFVVPSIVIICPDANYTMSDNNWVEVCLCMPLHQIQDHNVDGTVMIELNFQHDNSTVPGATMNVHTSMSRQCFDVEVPVRDLQYNMHNGTSLEMCLMLPGSSDATRCVHVPGSCVEITVSEDDKTTTATHDNTTVGSTITTSSDIDESKNGGLIAAIVIPLTLVFIGLSVSVILIISYTFWKKYCKKEGYETHNAKPDHKETLTKEIIQRSSGAEEKTANGKDIINNNLSEESDTEL